MDRIGVAAVTPLDLITAALPAFGVALAIAAVGDAIIAIVIVWIATRSGIARKR